jgi:cystathionine beta-lyase/cystathionine gamma-synthase
LNTRERRIRRALALEKNIAALEGAKFGFAFASGMSATDAVLKLVKAGDHVIVGDNTYGGTFRLFKQNFIRITESNSITLTRPT